jgi:hypothetical protein
MNSHVRHREAQLKYFRLHDDRSKAFKNQTLHLDLERECLRWAIALMKDGKVTSEECIQILENKARGDYVSAFIAVKQAINGAPPSDAVRIMQAKLDSIKARESDVFGMLWDQVADAKQDFRLELGSRRG